jgi:hypothetical protein
MYYLVKIRKIGVKLQIRKIGVKLQIGDNVLFLLILFFGKKIFPMMVVHILHGFHVY